MKYKSISSDKDTICLEHSVKLPKDFLLECPSCHSLYVRSELLDNSLVCDSSGCHYHFSLSASERISWFFGENDFELLPDDILSEDFLKFVDIKSYQERLDRFNKSNIKTDSFVTAKGSLAGNKVFVGVSEFSFLGGSLGSVKGEKIFRLFEQASKENAAVVIFSASGGARMQESTTSLMQMAKTTAAIKKFKDKTNLPYISVLTNPTTGGVSASYAFLGDFTFAEPDALICFAGPRVIKQTIGEDLPPEFQRSEFLFKKGMIDSVHGRPSLRKELFKTIKIFSE